MYPVEVPEIPTWRPPENTPLRAAAAVILVLMSAVNPVTIEIDFAVE